MIARAGPERFIRVYQLRDGESGREGPCLAGMTLDPSVVSEAWCYLRGYVCLIEEFGGRPIRPGESFQAAFIVGFFDSIEEMQIVYDEHRGHTARGEQNCVEVGPIVYWCHASTNGS